MSAPALGRLEYRDIAAPRRVNINVQRLSSGVSFSSPATVSWLGLHPAMAAGLSEQAALARMSASACLVRPSSHAISLRLRSSVTQAFHSLGTRGACGTLYAWPASRVVIHKSIPLPTLDSPSSDLPPFRCALTPARHPLGRHRLRSADIWMYSDFRCVLLGKPSCGLPYPAPSAHAPALMLPSLVSASTAPSE